MASPLLRKGDVGYGPECPSCGGPKAVQACRCMGCRRAAALGPKEAWRRWAADNREHLAQTQRVRRNASTPEGQASIAQIKAWRARNPERVRATNRRAKQRRRGMTALDTEYVEVLRGDPCSYCGAPSEHGDHIEPVARGGNPHWPNLTAACARCNHQKSARPLLAFLLSKEAA